jgi:hypothetical protein
MAPLAPSPSEGFFCGDSVCPPRLPAGYRNEQEPSSSVGVDRRVRRIGCYERRGVIESMTGARFVHDTLERFSWDVLIADAQKVKGLAPLAYKTDKIDARVLAVLAERDLVPERMTFLWVRRVVDRGSAAPWAWKIFDQRVDRARRVDWATGCVESSVARNATAGGLCESRSVTDAERNEVEYG